MFWFNSTIIGELAVCASLKSQYWCQLIYFFIKLFSRISAYAATRLNSLIMKYINWHQYCDFSEAQTASSPMMVELNRNM